MWKEAAEIIIVCTLASQMGLIGAIENILRVQFRILSCPKCLAFWLSLVWHLFHHRAIMNALAVSFLSSYVTLWICLLYDWTATAYNKIYKKIEKKTTASAKDKPRSDAMPKM